MTSFILLDAAQAAEVRGPSATRPWAEIRPVELADGRFVLTADVLDDPAHVAHRALLAGLDTASPAAVVALLPSGAE